MKATWNGTLIAESSDTVVVENNHYFPMSSVNKDYLQTSATTSYCPWKGTANYYSLAVDGAQNQDAMWYYADPKPKAEQIRDRVAFWHGVEITE